MKKLTQVFGCLLLPWGGGSLVVGCGEVIVGEPFSNSTQGAPGKDQGAPGNSDQAAAGSGAANRAPEIVDLGPQFASPPPGPASSPALERCRGDFSLGYNTVPLWPTDGPAGPSLLVDVNGDGLLDQVTVIPGEARSLLLQTTGEFDEPIVSQLPLGNPSALDAVDFNDDGHTDLATATVFIDGTSSVRILFGDGTGRFFEGPATETFSSSPGCAAGDVDSDGSPDLIVEDRGMIRFLIHQGDGTFVEQTSLNVPFSSPPIYHDWNGDGALDIAVSVHDSSSANAILSIFLGKGDGEFVLSQSYPLGASVAETLATGDVNGDGVDDIVVDLGDTKGFSPGVAIVAGIGDGTFEDAVIHGPSQYPFPDDDLDSRPDIWEGRTIEGNGQDVLDLNGDGVLDVFVNETLFGAYAELRTSDGAGEGQSFSPMVPFVGQFRLGNFDGDSNLDLFIGSAPDGSFGGSDPYMIAQGDGTGAFVLLGTPPGNWRGHPAWTVDLNQDGLFDWLSFTSISGVMSPAFSPNGAPAILIQLARGGDTFTEETHPLSAAGVAASAGDLDGDGAMDVVVAASEGWGSFSFLDVLFGRGDGSFEFGPTTQVWPTDARLTSLFQLADLDRDGALDAIVEVNGVDTWVFYGDGTGSFPRVALGAIGVPLALADLNRDGRLDLVTEAASEGRTFYTLSLGQNDGTLGRSRAFYEVIDYVGPNGPTAVEDFDEDGTLDFLRGRTIFRGGGDGTFSCVAYRAPGEGAVADLNDDGALDIVYGQSVGGREGVVTILGKRSGR